jgi:hypothetical protein
MTTTKYTNTGYNITHSGNSISIKVEIDSLRKAVERMVDANCLTCSKPIVAKDDFEADYHAECYICNSM